MDPVISRRSAMKLAGGAALLAMTKGCAAEGRPARAKAAAVGSETAFRDGNYVLPPLPYAYDALAPLHEERTLRIHHTKHHAGYVRGLNRTLEMLAAARRAGDYAAVKALSRALAFHGSGHVLHALYWNSMTPGGAKAPAGLAAAMKESFGTVAAAQAQFAAAAKAVEGSGWAVLAYEPIAGRLLILQAEKHQNLTVWGVEPLLVCDVWEHAYYLQFANDRARWVDTFMELANWDFAARRLEQARG
jgi:Fe-Mn family superoxide dismutase